MSIKIFGCGGTGLNILKHYLQKGAFKNDFEYIGMDTSDRNLFEDERLVIELVPNAHGSGGDVGFNSDKYPAFINKVLTQHGHGDLNIIVYSGSGGTGPSMGPTLHRALLEKEANVISMIIGDMSNINGATNTVRALLNLNDHTETGHPVIYSYRENGKGKTEGQVNDDVCAVIDVLRVLLSTENQRIDAMDIHHLFFYNNVVKATPILSCLEIIANDNAESYDKNAVAAISLFDNEDNVRSTFPNLLYNKAGIFAPRFSNPQFREIHAVLDHGDSVIALKEMLEKQRRVNAEINDKYQSTSDLQTPPVTERKGSFTKYDI